MSAFDAEVSVMSATIATPSEEALAEGAVPHLELGIVAGLALPFANPQTGKPVVIPLGKLRFAFERDQAIEVFAAGHKAAESLPEQFSPSGKLMVAQNMTDVSAAAENMKRVTGR